jgi:hypothetical protein
MLKHKPELLSFIFDDSDDTILDNIEKAKRESAAVLIDRRDREAHEVAAMRNAGAA